METVAALIVLAGPSIYYAFKAHNEWELEVQDVFKKWQSIKIFVLSIYVFYAATILIYGHQEIAGDDWIEYYLFPGFLFASIMLPNVVGEHLRQAHLDIAFVEEYVLFTSIIFLFLWVIQLSLDWTFF